MKARTLLGLGLAGLVSCRAPVDVVPPLAEKLPFHVAILPLEAVHRFELPDREDVTEMRFEPDREQLARTLADVLETSVFERATLLDVHRLPSPGRERAYVEAALESGADLILRCELWYHPGIWRQRRGSIYWPDPVLSWMFKDYIYRVEVELVGELYDPHTIVQARDVELGDDVARLLFTSAGFRGAPRTRREIGPAVVFVGEGEERQQFIRERVEQALATRLATNLAGKRKRLERFDPDVAPFWLVDPSVERRGTGRVRVTGSVHFQDDALPERMTRWELSCGVDRHDGPFGSPRRIGPGVLVYALDATLDVSADDEHVALELVAGDAELYVRSFTLPIEPGTPEPSRASDHQPK